MFKGRKIKVTKSNENSTLFIGNIRKTWSKSEIEAKVRRIFHNVSHIEYFQDPNNVNKNRGFCFAVFNNRNEAVKALNYVNNKNGINIDGIPVTCDWADVMDDDDSNSKQIFLSGLNNNVDENDLKNLFSLYGNVVNVVLSKNHTNSKRKDLAFITFENHEQAINAVKMFLNDKTLNGNDNIIKCFHIENEPNLIHKINISLAFSQQSIQTKKKIKDSRKKINQIKKNENKNNHNNNNSNNNNNINNKEENIILNNNKVNNNQNNNLNLTTLLSNLQNQLVTQNIMNINSLTPNQLVAMTNLINIFKENPNILQTVANIGNNINNNSNEIKENSFKQNNNYLNKKRRNNNVHNQDNNLNSSYNVLNNRNFNNNQINGNFPKYFPNNQMNTFQNLNHLNNQLNFPLTNLDYQNMHSTDNNLNNFQNN